MVAAQPLPCAAPDRDPETAGTWPASLAVRLGVRADRTRLLEAEHEGPLRVQRAFHPEPDGTAHLVLLHPPAGMVGGDRLSIRVDVERGARALITTTGASKAYRTNGSESALETALSVAEGAFLEYVPQETLCFDGARSTLRTTVELAENAAFLGWEVVCLGRPACGERFERGALRLELAVRCAGSLRFLERGSIEGGSPWMDRAYGAQGRAAFGTMLATHGEPAAIRIALEHAIPEGALLGVTRVAGLTVVRALGRDGAEVRALLARARHVVRDAWERPRIDPAIWRS